MIVGRRWRWRVRVRASCAGGGGEEEGDEEGDMGSWGGRNIKEFNLNHPDVTWRHPFVKISVSISGHPAPILQTGPNLRLLLPVDTVHSFAFVATSQRRSASFECNQDRQQTIKGSTSHHYPRKSLSERRRRPTSRSV